jgi:hypothetical protein
MRLLMVDLGRCQKVGCTVRLTSQKKRDLKINMAFGLSIAESKTLALLWQSTSSISIRSGTAFVFNVVF